MRSFPLAPMDTFFRFFTVPVLALPLLFFTAPPLRVVGVFLIAIYASVWFVLRPSRFEAAPGRVTVIFPLRRRVFEDIRGAEHISLSALYKRYGGLVRVGAGGLWGGFGWLWRPGRKVEFYISRRDGLVLLQRAGEVPLLISPQDPQGFVAAVGPADASG